MSARCFLKVYFPSPHPNIIITLYAIAYQLHITRYPLPSDHYISLLHPKPSHIPPRDVTTLVLDKNFNAHQQFPLRSPLPNP